MTSTSLGSADSLVAKLGLLLTNETTCPWREVLATAQAIKQATALLPEASDMRHALDIQVISRSYHEIGRPDLAVECLENALLAICDNAVARNACIQQQMAQELHVRSLMRRCYQACLTEAQESCSCESQATAANCHISSTSPAPDTNTGLQDHSCQHCQQQHQQPPQQHCRTANNARQLQEEQQYHAACLANSQRMLQLASGLNEHQQHAHIAADIADQYACTGDASNACRYYAMCMDACAAASASAACNITLDGGWIQALLICVVPAAVNAHLSQGDTAGARRCLTTYNNLLLAAGKSACEECAVCYEPLTGATAVTLLTCGHIFHRDCCNEWFGHKLFESGKFQAECPLCRQVDEAVLPSQTALKALEELQQYHTEASSDDEQDSEMSLDDSEDLEVEDETTAVGLQDSSEEQSWRHDQVLANRSGVSSQASAEDLETTTSRDPVLFEGDDAGSLETSISGNDAAEMEGDSEAESSVAGSVLTATRAAVPAVAAAEDIDD